MNHLKYILIGFSVCCFLNALGQQREWIHNPILPGFNPDPAILRVDDNYFIATSSFEWFPGVPLYHSKDLKNWQPIGHALTRKSQANLRGIPASAGIYAPSLHHHKGRFYLIYTVVQTSEGWPMTSTPNYLIHTDDIFSGKWSEPVYLNSVGFDPSLFFDEDGKTYALSMVMDFRLAEPTMGKIALQEIDLESGNPLSEMKIIFDTHNLWGTEGPHIYKKDGFYYLLIAQGGTFYQHVASLARSENLWGDYELAPNTPFMTSKSDSTLRLQRAGHGSLIETQNGEWYMAHLASRSLMPDRKSPLGREGCLQKVEWTTNGWLQLAHGSIAPADSIPAPDLPEYSFEPLAKRDEFDSATLRLDYQYLREMPDTSWLRLQKGALHLRGRRPPTSRYDLSLVARRITSYQTRAETSLTFEAESYRHKAGLAAYYDHRHFYWLAVSHDDSLGSCVEVLGYENGKYRELAKTELEDQLANIQLRFEVSDEELQFSFREEEGWQPIGEPLYFGNLADEQEGHSGFTGSMAALLAMDVLHEKKWAVFEYFTAQNREPQKNEIQYPYTFTATENPIIQHIRTSDPDCHVWEDGKLWMYVSQDHQPREGEEWYEAMDGYHAYSTEDLITWIDHGEILHSKDISWGMDGWMWAPGAAYKDGTYYLYYPHREKENGKFKIGVAISNKPEGPFKDIGHYIEGTYGIDPMCFIDDDGQAYLYFHQDVAKLKPNMVELAEKPRKIDYGANDRSKTNEDMVEASWIYKKDGLYYFSYSNYKNKEYQSFYGVGKSPYGPFAWKGKLNPKPPKAQDHHSIVKFKGQWYYFYHVGNFTNAQGEEGKSNQRNVCVDHLYHNEDGTMKVVKQTKGSVY